MEKQIRIVHYLNQFFGQIGGEDKADVGFSVVNGPVGPGVLLQKLMNGKGVVAATVICGDNYFTRDTEKTIEEGLQHIAELKPGLFVAGPAFFAGRYGVACAAISEAVQDRLRVPSITGMFPDNPAVDMCRKKVYIVSTGNSAATMADAMKKIVALALKLEAKESIGRPEAEGYIPQGFVRNERLEQTGAERAIGMLMAKLGNQPFETELTLPVFEQVSPAPKVDDIQKTVIALVSDGGLIPKANPDKFRASQNTVFAGYNIDEFISQPFSVSHSGYHHSDVRKDINRLLPIDIMKQMVEEGRIGGLLPVFYSTSGNTVTVKTAQKIGRGIAEKIKGSGAQAVILTST